MVRRIAMIVGIAFVVIILLMQMRTAKATHRPVESNATIDARLHPSPQISNMLHQSCYNCHSEQGETPWYAHAWPASDLLQKDIRQGRARLDFSEWDRLSPEMSRIRLLDSCRMMRESKMPVWYYRPMHPETSTPDPKDVDAFCQWAQSQPVGNASAQLTSTDAH
jgi:hypothetical protein